MCPAEYISMVYKINKLSSCLLVLILATPNALPSLFCKRHVSHIWETESSFDPKFTEQKRI